MLSPHPSGKSCILLMSKWHLLNTIDQTEHFIDADDSTSCLQKDNKTSDINPLQQGTDDNKSLPEEGGKKNKENKESKRRGENENGGKGEFGSGRSRKEIKTNESEGYGKDATACGSGKSQDKPHNPHADNRDTPSLIPIL